MAWKFNLRRKKKCCAAPEEIPLPQGVLHYQTQPPYVPPIYVPPTDKEMIEGLEMCGSYEEACRLRDLKKEVANLKRKLTILQKKYDGVTKP